jgi:hypothetical protein
VLEEQEQAVGRVNGLSTTEEQQPAAIDAFLESISKTIPQPLLTPRPQHTFPSQPASPPPSINKRQSTRLAKKATTNSGKGAIEIAQELLVKKLGNLAGTVDMGTNKLPTPDDFDLYAQHFARPLEKSTMEAIQHLIEHGAMIQKKKGDIQREAAENQGLVA